MSGAQCGAAAVWSRPLTRIGRRVDGSFKCHTYIGELVRTKCHYYWKNNTNRVKNRSNHKMYRRHHDCGYRIVVDCDWYRCHWCELKHNCHCAEATISTLIRNQMKVMISNNTVCKSSESKLEFDALLHANSFLSQVTPKYAKSGWFCRCRQICFWIYIYRVFFHFGVHTDFSSHEIKY